MNALQNHPTRKRENFKDVYEQLCAIHDCCPLHVITSKLEENEIDCNVDRIRQSDWTPILGALKCKNYLRVLAFRSFWLPNAGFEEGISQQKAFLLRKRTPAVRSRNITNNLSRSLQEMLTVSSCISCLTLQGIPLREKDLDSLTNGILKNKSLQSISFKSSRIGDAGIEVLSIGLKSLLHLKTLCLSGCSLTWRGMETICDIIKHQATKRHGEAWQESLRYRRPDLDGMLGLRRIDLCQNTLIGDNGAQILSDTLKDDLWIKAIDLQQCGISSVGADALLSVLNFNTGIRVLDVRLNPLLEREKVKLVLEKVMLNCGGEDPEYPWKSMKISNETKKTRSNRRAIRFTLNNSITGSQSIRKKKTKRMEHKSGQNTNVYTPFVNGQNRNNSQKRMKKIQQRTAANAVIESDENSRYHHQPSHLLSNERLVLEDLEGHHKKYEDVKDLKVQLTSLTRRYHMEIEHRTNAELRLRELEAENQNLRNEVMLLKSKLEDSPNDPSNRLQSGILEDAKVLESIESSFRQFQRFLDQINATDLGEIYKKLVKNPAIPSLGEEQKETR